MSQKNFAGHGNRCFQIKFMNGLVLSMNIGACGYNDNHNSSDFTNTHVETDTVEIAVWDENAKERQNWLTKTFFKNAEDGKCSVVGYVSIEEFSEALPKIIEWGRANV